MIRGSSRRAFEYAQVDGCQLQVIRHRPIISEVDRPPAWPWVVHVDGGGWSPEPSGLVDGRDLSAAGFAAFDLVTRDLTEAPHPAAMLDVERALRFVVSRREAESLDDRAVLVGVRSGAHSLLGAYCSSPALRREFSPLASVVGEPEIDPYTTWLRAGQPASDRVAEYFGTPTRMRRAVVAEQIFDGVATQLPRLLILHTGVAVGPPECADELAYAWRRAGGAVDRADGVTGVVEIISGAVASARIEGPDTEEAVT